MFRNILSIGRTSSRECVEIATLTNSLAAEYGLLLSYRKTFNEVLQEEQSSRDFGPLLSRMGVIDEQGQSAMDANQWEAASKSSSYMPTQAHCRSVHGLCV